MNDFFDQRKGKKGGSLYFGVWKLLFWIKTFFSRVKSVCFNPFENRQSADTRFKRHNSLTVNSLHEKSEQNSLFVHNSLIINELQVQNAEIGVFRS